MFLYSKQQLMNASQCILLLFIFTAKCQANTTADSLPSGCYYTNYTTASTQCSMKFLYCYNYHTLNQCIINKCSRFVRANDCRLWISFLLPQQDCYNQCCGASSFDENQCDSYNQQKLAQQSQMDKGLLAILIVSIVILLLVVTFFVIRRIKCLEKNEPFRIMKYNIKWKTQSFADQKCEICHTHGALLITPCEHSFHPSCFEEAVQDMFCPKCSIKIQDRIKIFCFHCRAKSFKVKIWKKEEITDAIAEGKALHFDLCPREIKSTLNLKDELQSN